MPPMIFKTLQLPTNVIFSSSLWLLKKLISNFGATLLAWLSFRDMSAADKAFLVEQKMGREQDTWDDKLNDQSKTDTKNA